MSARRSPPPGTVFLVPLRDRGFVTGVLARAGRRGVCLGYFFGPRLAGPEEARWEALAPERALLVGKFGDLELLRGAWPILGSLDGWRAEAWPVPQLVRVDDIDGSARLSTYDDSLRCVREEVIDPADAAGFPYDRLMGAGAAEIRLTALISQADRGASF